jgi:hypothetical protein
MAGWSPAAVCRPGALSHRLQPLTHERVGIAGVVDQSVHARHCPQGETDQGIGNLEGAGRREALLGPLTVVTAQFSSPRPSSSSTKVPTAIQVTGLPMDS